jgi:DNA-binding MarR family transcriptional regulator
VIVALTAHGFDVYRSVAVQHAQTIADQVGAGLDDDELRTLTELCTKLRTAAGTSDRRPRAPEAVSA